LVNSFATYQYLFLNRSILLRPANTDLAQYS
jgi:hypothetical protein